MSLYLRLCKVRREQGGQGISISFPASMLLLSLLSWNGKHIFPLVGTASFLLFALTLYVSHTLIVWQECRVRGKTSKTSKTVRNTVRRLLRTINVLSFCLLLRTPYFLSSFTFAFLELFSNVDVESFPLDRIFFFPGSRTLFFHNYRRISILFSPFRVSGWERWRDALTWFRVRQQRNNSKEKNALRTSGRSRHTSLLTKRGTSWDERWLKKNEHTAIE